MNFKSNEKKLKYGCTIWLTGLSGSGKTTIAQSVCKYLESYNLPVHTLDGDDLRQGLNNDLGFSETDRAENVRRVAEVAALFARKNHIVLVSLISPFEIGRAKAREIHEREQVEFFIAYVNTPLEICERNDPKRLYERARAGQVANFTGVTMRYEVPGRYELLLEPSRQSVHECQQLVCQLLSDQGFIPRHLLTISSCNLNVEQLPLDGACVGGAANEREIFLIREACELLPRIEITKKSLEWAQIIGEGWAWPLDGFMTEFQLLECLHFNTFTRDSIVHNQSIPIVLSLPADDIGLNGEPKVNALRKRLSNLRSFCLTYNNRLIGCLSDVEIYKNRKLERCARTFGTLDLGHPTIRSIMQDESDCLAGGKLQLFQRIKWNDGLDEYRLTPLEIRQRLVAKKADAVFVFQLRNPLHNGHILLINETRRKLCEEKGHENPILLLHPIGGWTKDDDVPLIVRIRQHQTLLDENILDLNKTILSIFPSPMSYAGPTEVQWHAKARLVVGIDYYIVGRDPAGLKDPSNPEQDLYDPTHGAKVLQIAPGLSNRIEILPFKIAAYNKIEQKMTFFDSLHDSVDNFEMISGTKMRSMARENLNPPEQFMHPKAWKVLADYYRSLMINSNFSNLNTEIDRTIPIEIPTSTKITISIDSAVAEGKQNQQAQIETHDIEIEEMDQEENVIG